MNTAAASLRSAALTINGEPVTTARRMPVINPATAAVFAEVPDGGVEEIDAAVRCASRAFRVWSAHTAEDRRKIVNAYLDVVREHTQELAELITLEQGKPLEKGVSEVNSALFFAAGYVAIDLAPEVLRDSPAQRVELHRRPLGVVGAITAWNYPVLLALWKIVPALLTGNTVVLKPAPTTPLATLRLGELSRGVLPPGVLNVVSGGAEAGARLTAHPDVRKIAFTGSGATGQRIMAAAAPTLKRMTLELGGNDAGIVLPDVQPKKVASDLFWAKFSNCGQVCAGLKRLFIHDSVYDTLCKELVAVARTVHVGEGHQSGVQIGPVQNLAQFDRLKAMLADALAHGARVVYQGDVPEGPGYFFPVTILDDVTERMAVVREEAFGPILTLQRWHELDSVLAQANQTEFGLGGSVWGSDMERASAVAARLEAGSVWVNQHPAMGPEIPFGGIKGSGIGVECGRLGLEEYTAVQVVNVKRS